MQQGCVPLSGVNFTDISTGSAAVNRHWDLGNGTIIPNGAATVGTNYLSAGTFRVTLTVVFSNGDTKNISKNVTVHPKPVAAFSSNDTMGCNPHSVTFQDMSTTATGSIANWQWDFGAGGSTVQNPGFIYMNPGSYQVSLIVKNNWGCSSEAASKPAYVKVYNKPVAGFTSNANSSCDIPFPVQFTNTTTGSGPVTYEWDFGDGSSVSNEVNPSHTYTVAGVYRVRLTTKIGNNCSNSVSTNFYTDIRAGKPIPSIQSFDTVCVGNTILFNGTATPAPLAYQYKWHFSDNASVSYGANVNHLFANAGDFEVMLVSSAYYGCADSVRKKIHVKPGPVADFSANRVNGCSVPFSVNFTSTATPSAGLAYVWDFGDGNSSALPHPLHTYTYAGSFTVRLTVTDTSITDGCSATITKSSYIRIRIPTINFTFVPPAGCKPLPVVATAAIGNMIEPLGSLIWNWGDGYQDTVTNGALIASHVYTTAGSFNIQATIITASGCRYSSILRPVSVEDVCDDDGGGGGGGGGGAGYVIGKTCADKYQVTFTDTVSNTIVTRWDFGDGVVFNTGVLNPVTHAYSPPQKVYPVTVTRRDTITNAITTGQKNIIIIDEKANFAPDITDICANKKVNFHTLGIDSSKIKKYTWDFGDGKPRFTINNLNYFNSYGLWLNGNTSHVYDSSGVFYVKLIIEDKTGCLDSIQYPVPITVAGPRIGFSGMDLISCNQAAQTVVFRDSSVQNGSTPIIEWKWDFGDGSPVYVSTSDTSITHIYNNPSYYNFRTVTLSIKDAAGCEATISKTNYVKSYRPQAGFFSYDTLRCGVFNVFLYNQSSAYNATYLWDYGDGNTSTGYYGSHTYAGNGAYNIKLVATDESGCKDSVSKAGYVKIIEPVADFKIGDTLQCAPAAIAFTDTSRYATAWEWDFGDGGTGSTDKNPAPHIYAKPGIYRVRLVVRGVNGCTDTVYKSIRIRGPIAAWNAAPASGCKPFDFHAKVTGSYISAYAWDYGDGTPVNASLSDSVISHSYINAGKYLPNLVLTSPEGCPVTLKLQDSIIVDSAKADFSPQSGAFCGSGTVTFSDLSKTPDFSSVTGYQWNFGDGSPISSAAAPPPHAYGPGDFTVSLMIQSQYGCNDTIFVPHAVKVDALPYGNIAGDSIHCSPGSYQYDFNSGTTDSIHNYQWTVNGVNTGTNNASLKRHFAAGNYIIGLRLTTANNCSNYLERTIIVDSVKAAYEVINPVRCGDDLSVRFNNLSQGHFGINGWQWSFGDNTTYNQQSPPAHSYPTSGTYNVSLIAVSVNGCRDTFRTSPGVIIYTKPTVDFTGLPEACTNSNLKFKSQINSQDTITGYSWAVNGTPAGSDTVFNHLFTTAGTFSVSLTVSTKNGCAVTQSKQVVIHPLPVPSAMPDATICTGTSITLSAYDGTHFEWSPAAGVQGANTASPVVSPTSTTKYKVKVTNQYGCIQYDSTLVRVDERVLLRHSRDQITCGKVAVKLTASGNSNQFIWSPATGLNATVGATVIANPASTTTYSVTGVSSNVCPNDTGYITITVGGIPTVNLGPDITVKAGTEVTLSAVTTGGVVSYTWLPAKGLSCTSCAQPRFIANEDITYKATVRTQYGCEASDEIQIKVLCNESAVYIPNAFTPNYDGINDVFYIKGYGIARIRHFTVYDRWGKAVFQRNNIAADDRSQGWNGRVSNQEVSATTVFVYVAEIECAGGDAIILKGPVTLIR